MTRQPTLLVTRRPRAASSMWVAGAALAVGVAVSPAQAAPPPAPLGSLVPERPAPKAAAEHDSAEAHKVLRKLVNAIRYHSDDKAVGLLDFTTMAQRLTQEAWGEMTEKERAEVVRGLVQILRAKSFERGRDVFKYLNTIRLEPARLEGDTIVVHAVAVIFRDMKKSEVLIDWVLMRGAGGLRVVDTIMLGERTSLAIYEEQVRPLLKEGGVPALMAALRGQVAEADRELGDTSSAGAGAAPNQSGQP